MNVLQDLKGFVKRNSRNWKAYQVKKCLSEAKEIVDILERQLKKLERVS